MTETTAGQSENSFFKFCIWNIGHCDLFVICDLLFGIYNMPLAGWFGQYL
jgi:hypothetical protein